MAGRGGRFFETVTPAAGVRPILLAVVPEGAMWRVVLGTALLA